LRRRETKLNVVNEDTTCRKRKRRERKIFLFEIMGKA
jgi:hypothetical protein